MSLLISRRALLATGGALGVFAVSRATLGSHAERPQLVMLHRRLVDHKYLPASTRNANAKILTLEPDVVRQWRAGLQNTIRDAQAALAIVPWAEATVLTGLIRELGGGVSMKSHGAHFFELTISIRSPSQHPN